jgi:hypothetical protein
MKRTINKNLARILGTISLFLILSHTAKCNYPNPEDLHLLKNLNGNWHFSIGLNNDWIQPKFDDSKWETIEVPGPWEDQGFNGYNGYAFYRKNIDIPLSWKDRDLYLNMGYIDDVDEVYLNGHKIGSTGSFPPNYSTAYDAERIYYIPVEYINFDGSNLIAVKVYDSYESGGIVSGDIGLYSGKTAIGLDINLQSLWKFQPGDDMRRKEIQFDDENWAEIFVPAKWEDQGFRDYDGYAWYRKTFNCQLPENEKLVLVLGKIDDIDQVFINGVVVGSTGNFPSNGSDDASTGAEFNAFRGYYIPDGVIKKGQNIIAVRILDTGGSGGIYEGPVGLITQGKYIEYWRNIKKAKN